MANYNPNANVPKVKGCVYLALCRTNAKIYIGKTTKCLWDRVDEHFAESKRSSHRPFCHTLAKYGRHAFQWFVLFESNDDSELLSQEVRMIAEFRSNERGVGYNLTDGGEGTSGFVCPSEVVQKRIENTAQVVNFQGESLTIKQWAERLKIKEATLRNRLKKGWPVKYALRKTSKRFHYNPNNRKGTLYEFDGQSRKLSEWAEHLGVKCGTLQERLRKGWSIEKTLSTPVRKKAPNGQGA